MCIRNRKPTEDNKDTSIIHSFNPLSILTFLWPLPKPTHHRGRESASTFNFKYPLISLRSSSSCLPLLLRLPVTSVLACVFPWITCFRRQFLLKMWRNRSVFLLFIVCRILFSSLTLRNASWVCTRSVRLITAAPEVNAAKNRTSFTDKFTCW